MNTSSSHDSRAQASRIVRAPARSARRPLQLVATPLVATLLLTLLQTLLLTLLLSGAGGA